MGSSGDSSAVRRTPVAGRPTVAIARSDDEGTAIREAIKLPARLQVNRLYEEMDHLVSFTVIKQYEEAVCSLSLKNVALSWPPTEIHGFPKCGCGVRDAPHR